jgi:hypothetical protein
MTGEPLLMGYDSPFIQRSGTGTGWVEIRRKDGKSSGLYRPVQITTVIFPRFYRYSTVMP